MGRVRYWGGAGRGVLQGRIPLDSLCPQPVTDAGCGLERWRRLALCPNPGHSWSAQQPSVIRGQQDVGSRWQGASLSDFSGN